ncbi:E3 ubiquitin-protein ligase TRIM21 isoform X1 [Octodon degus]|uniref:E3 ubiquitin-protein ligase TRIM21 isoform X1 n=1 Tax=Octodon degus TaxID=10160 RepID=A0A6P6DDB0_OCTDE|nr:E3 ubiquitin-protein ligase TRIM21 isoform X1 [Octodon degus]XP_023557898.1 E3 ubiquitin-protein ligase TRIM21 isoform X1 [Octodon degus]XP_023557899.1 E3 ubiquitin-protein ligase TRIM21 isoform X1 [Octodon degus]XP_023557900.1 E3 ubiquitin-protein ligase TRIM21 isoform X1 [Octodon degus]
MASANSLAMMWEEVTCCICLEPMVEPVSIECGHSFCRACISEVGKSGGASCPECRQCFLLKNFRPNRHLANMVDMLRQMSQAKISQDAKQSAPGERCTVHGKKLHLFCEKDQQALCLVCSQTKKHREHAIISIEEAAREYQEKIQVALEKLRKQQVLAEEMEVNLAMKKADWKKEVGTQKSKIHAAFVQQRNFLAEEEQRQMQKLEKDEREQLRILGETEFELTQKSQALQALVSELERKSKGSPLELLQDVTVVLERSESWNLTELDIASPSLKSEFCVPGLKAMLRTCGVYVTLDRDTANQWLLLSDDRRQVRFGNARQNVPENPERFNNYPVVLGSQSFNSGKFYWEVDVTGKEAWDLGVCRDSVQRKGIFLFSPDNGFWTIWLWNKEEYHTGAYPNTPLQLQVPPRQVGIFLDYEAGTVSFYNISDHGSLIYTFSECAFAGPVRPFFNPGFNDSGNNAAPLTLCPLKM